MLDHKEFCSLTLDEMLIEATIRSDPYRARMSTPFSFDEIESIISTVQIWLQNPQHATPRDFTRYFGYLSQLHDLSGCLLEYSQEE